MTSHSVSALTQPPFSAAFVFAEDSFIDFERFFLFIAKAALNMPFTISFRITNAVSATPHQLMKGYIVSTILSKPRKLIGKAIRMQKKTTIDLPSLSLTPIAGRSFTAVSMMRSESILREETSVVNIAPAMRIPQTTLRLNFSATAKTGIDECNSSDKTTVCNINNIANRQIQMKEHESRISL